MNTQRFLGFIAFLSIFSLIFALFSQHVLGMLPCAWCVFQRFILVLIAVVCLIAQLFHVSFLQRLFAFISFVLSVGGVLSAWYQYRVAANMFSCDMTFADLFMAHWTELDRTVPWLFGIYASCMDAKVDLFGVEYALWALALFAVTGILSLIAIFKTEHREIFS